MAEIDWEREMRKFEVGIALLEAMKRFTLEMTSSEMDVRAAQRGILQALAAIENEFDGDLRINHAESIGDKSYKLLMTIQMGDQG
jgi:hypothetical protein